MMTPNVCARKCDTGARSALSRITPISATKPTGQVDIPQYLPEPFVKVANEKGWTINMHLVKTRAVVDPSNIH